MKKLSKLYEDLAIDLKHDLFFQARLKLTVFYVLIIAVILSVSTFFLYKNIIANLGDISEENFLNQQAEQKYVNRASENVRDTLLLLDLIVLVGASVLSYVLAGKTLKPIQETLEIQKRFAADASHELRTPLAIMKTENEVMLRNNYPAKDMVQGILRSNVEEIDKMTKIIDDLLLVARSRYDNELEVLHLSSLVSETVGRISKLAEEKRITIGPVDRKEFKIKGNKTLLERAFMNIFQNALEHTQAGGSITIDLYRDGKNALIKITDTGEGIEEKHLPFVFDRFYKVDSSRSNKTGSGLGLSIVKEIVDKHNGAVSIQSLKDKGTSVILTFPLA